MGTVGLSVMAASLGSDVVPIINPRQGNTISVLSLLVINQHAPLSYRYESLLVNNSLLSARSYFIALLVARPSSLRFTARPGR